MTALRRLLDRLVAALLFRIDLTGPWTHDEEGDDR